MLPGDYVGQVLARYVADACGIHEFEPGGSMR
jgi:hypothetical protein